MFGLRITSAGWFTASYRWYPTRTHSANSGRADFIAWLLANGCPASIHELRKRMA